MANFLNPENDCILVQTDAAFNVCLMALTGLGNNLQYESMQEVSIENIESNNPYDFHRFVFGGRDAASPARRTQAFAKTASGVLRMCMLRSANAGHCPQIGPNSQARNRNKMNVSVHSVFGPNAPRFALSPTNNKLHIMEYYSYYDKMHPHFMIENELLQRRPGERWSMGSTMMLVFRRGFSEVVEFSTNMDAADLSGTRDPGTFTSYVNVRCIVRKITDPNHPSLQLLKALCDHGRGAQHIFDTYQQGLRMNWRQDVPFPPYPAESSEESDDYEESEDEEDGEFLSPVPVAQAQMRPPNYYVDDQPQLGELNLQIAAMGLK